MSEPETQSAAEPEVEPVQVVAPLPAELDVPPVQVDAPEGAPSDDDPTQPGLPDSLLPEGAYVVVQD